jgi:copper chaperone
MNQSLSFDIDGMTCGGCTASVQRTLGKIDGVSHVQVSLNPGGAVVVADAGRVSAAQIESALAVLGYSAKLRAVEQDGQSQR